MQIWTVLCAHTLRLQIHAKLINTNLNINDSSHNSWRLPILSHVHIVRTLAIELTCAINLFLSDTTTQIC